MSRLFFGGKMIIAKPDYIRKAATREKVTAKIFSKSFFWANFRNCFPKIAVALYVVSYRKI